MPIQTPAEVLGVEKLPPTLTISQTAEVLGVSRQTLYRSIAAGETPSIAVRGSLRVPSWYIESLLTQPEG